MGQSWLREHQPRCTILSPGSFPISFVLLLLLPRDRHPGGCSPPRAPHASQQLIRAPPCPWALWAPRKPPPPAVQCLLGPAPARAPPLAPGAALEGSVPGDGTVLLYRCYRMEHGTIGASPAPPAPAREPRVGLVGFIFVGLFSFFVLCFFPARAGVTPSPRAPGRQPPLPGPGSASGKPRGCFCLWVCILVALSDFCFIISSNRLWCQKH